jgi:hypothetical protein
MEELQALGWALVAATAVMGSGGAAAYFIAGAWLRMWECLND